MIRFKISSFHFLFVLGLLNPGTGDTFQLYTTGVLATIFYLQFGIYLAHYDFQEKLKIVRGYFLQGFQN